MTDISVNQRELRAIIGETIYRQGPISFCEFMERCLYTPYFGYYCQDREPVGRSGDFYTSVEASSLFGFAIARQLQEMWNILGQNEFTVLEYGGGSGLLCRDILECLAMDNRFFERLTYFIVDKRPPQKDLICAFPPGKVVYLENTSALGVFEGCVLSNELIDNFSFHRVKVQNGLKEIFVDFDGTFHEELRSASQELLDYFSFLEVSLPDGFSTEVNLEPKFWLREVNEHLNRGFVMTFDYGGSSDELYNSRKNSGTMTCFYDHTVNFRPYDHIGEQDIMAQVNFSAIEKWGELLGLISTGYTNQQYFLRALGLADTIRMLEATKIDHQKAHFFLQKFLMEIGNRVKVLVQQKDVALTRLSGMQFPLPL